METTNIKIEEKSDTKQIVFLILIFFAVLALIFATIQLIKNKELIKQDGIKYEMQAKGMSYCSCFDDLGKHYEFVRTEEMKKNGTRGNIKDIGEK